MIIRIRKIKIKDIQGYHFAVSSIAKEKKYILTLDPPGLEKFSKFVHNSIEHNYAHYIALNDKTIVGWAHKLMRIKKCVLSVVRC